MLKKIIVTILLLLFFFSVYSFLGVIALMHNNFLTGSESQIVNFDTEWGFAALSLIPLILTPLNTLIFIKSKKNLRWFVVLLPIVLIIIYFISFYVLS